VLIVDDEHDRRRRCASENHMSSMTGDAWESGGDFLGVPCECRSLRAGLPAGHAPRSACGRYSMEQQ
jgi:hypothetical protein